MRRAVEKPNSILDTRSDLVLRQPRIESVVTESQEGSLLGFKVTVVSFQQISYQPIRERNLQKLDFLRALKEVVGGKLKRTPCPSRLPSKATAHHRRRFSLSPVSRLQQRLHVFPSRIAGRFVYRGRFYDPPSDQGPSSPPRPIHFRVTIQRCSGGGRNPGEGLAGREREVDGIARSAGLATGTTRTGFSSRTELVGRFLSLF